MVELTEESLIDCISRIQGMTEDREELLQAKPTKLLMQVKYIRLADRIINKWKGKRAVWLRGKR